MYYYAENLHKGHIVSILLSCPGKHELELQKPAAMQTGANLEMVLKFLGLTRDQVAIDNASVEVLYKAKDGRTEAKISEIRQPTNIDRLEQELLPDTKIIIAMGHRAFIAAQKLQERHRELIVIKGRHPGFSSMNRIKKDVNQRQIKAGAADSTYLRAEVIANMIRSQMDKLNIRLWRAQ